MRGLIRRFGLWLAGEDAASRTVTIRYGKDFTTQSARERQLSAQRIIAEALGKK